MFYDRLKAECEKQGLKITPIVVECAGSSGIISQWKKGGMSSVKTLIALAKKLNVSADYLLGLNDE